MDKKQAQKIYKNLEILIDEPKSELEFSTTFELLVAVMLSAQCTDKRVNMVTRQLFKIANTPSQFAKMQPEELEKLIYSTGFYKNKAKNIIEMSKVLLKEHNGLVPSTFEELVKLPGVGRKTANVVLVVGFNKPAIPVDTHVFRVSNRLGLTKAKTPLECEKQLEKLFEPKYYGKLHHLLILFGRYYCTARNKSCNADYLQKLVDNKINKKE